MSDERRDLDADFADEEDREIAELKRQLASTDSELQQSKELQKTLEGAASGSGEAVKSEPFTGEVPIGEGEDAAAKEEVDARSVFVGSVDYQATPEEIQQHFQACGAINRITILCDKFTGHPKGYAYVEFAEASSVTNAMVLNESMFRGRQLSVTAKRTNRPAWQRDGPRGRGRGGYRGGYRGRGGYAPYRARGRGRGRGGY